MFFFEKKNQKTFIFEGFNMNQLPSRTTLLVINAPEDQAELHASTADIDAAVARAKNLLPPLDARCLIFGHPDVAEAMATANILLGWRLPTDIIQSHGNNLRLVQSVNAGIDNLLPLDWLPPGAALCTASGIHGPKLQEWATMVLLMLHGRMPFFATAQRAHVWSRHATPLIAGKTVLIYGTGGLGSAVARAARALGLAVHGVSRSGAPAEDFATVVTPENATPHLQKADFVVLTLPLTQATRGIANAEFFGRMRQNAGFANFGRGALVDQAALCAALESGALSGAIIDVASPEPLPAESPLWATKNLIITPHVSCDDPATYIADALDLLMDNFARLASGQALRNLIDPQKLY
jgi:phosphoglycerate dehydrogenase-like enzyme